MRLIFSLSVFRTSILRHVFVIGGRESVIESAPMLSNRYVSNWVLSLLTAAMTVPGADRCSVVCCA